MKSLGSGFHTSKRLRRSILRRVTGVVLLVLALLTAVPVANAADAGAPGFPLPAFGSLFAHPRGSFGNLPKQTGGTAAGKSHIATADSTRAGVGDGTARGKGKGELDPAKQPPLRKVAAGSSAKGTAGFDARTSKEDPSKRTKTSKAYVNADGSMTVKYFADQVNYQAPDGSMQPIDTALVPAVSPKPGSSGGIGALGLSSVRADAVTTPIPPTPTSSSSTTPTPSPSNTPSSTTASSASSTPSPSTTGSVTDGPRLVRKAGDSSVSLASNGADLNLMTVGTGSASVSFGLSGAASVTATTSGAQATYASIMPGVDLELATTNTGVKQLLVLKSASAPTEFVFPYTVTGVLTPKVTDKGVEFVDASGTSGILVPNALMTDSRMNAATGSGAESTNIVYSLTTTTDGKPALRMSLDAAWLAAPQRQFPVNVDPSAQPFQSNDTATMDTSTSPMGTYAGDLKIGSYDGTHDGAAFVQFTGVTSFQNWEITGATVNLWHTYSSSCSVAEPIKLMQITNNWNIGSVNSYPGVPYNGNLLGSLNVVGGQCGGASGEWDSVPLNSSGVRLLQDWAQAIQNNYGFLVSSETSDANGWKRFSSFAQGGLTIPSLTVNYQQNVPPQVDSQYPGNNAAEGTLTPELLATGHDPDNFPYWKPFQYDFQVFNSGGTKVADSGAVGSGDWTVPSGVLNWNQSYAWTVQTFDGLDYSPNPVWNYFATTVPQPPITSTLSQNSSGKGFDAAAGNYTVTATDADVAGVGPGLQVTRDYNSRDPRVSGAFGAAWSSVFDSRASEQYNPDGSVASVNVAYPDGSESGYGRNADGSFTPPPGHYAQVKQVSGGGYTLTDKNETVYAFTQRLNNGVYGITSVTDATGRSAAFTWAGGQITTMASSTSGRALHLNWTLPSGASASHVATVVTDPVTAGTSSSALTWTYTYSGDQLTAVCSPVDSSPGCTRYSYTSGSPFPASVLNTAPVSYWRLSEQAGSTAASSVLVNEGVDNETYNAVNLGQTPALPGSAATSVTLNGGAGSYIATNAQNLAAAGSYASIGGWFKTTSSGIIFYYGDQPLSNIGATKTNTPALYVGTDGKLHGCFATGNCATTQVTSTAAVNDGNWHFAVLSGTGNKQYLYLDGVSQGSVAGTIQSWKQPYITVGSGLGGSGWPYLLGGVDGFIGSLSDVAVWNKPLTPNQVQTLYSAGTHVTSLLTGITKPSGNTDANVTYNPSTGTVSTVTDSEGGTWTVQAPTVTGSSQVFRSSVMAASPSGYWRLGDAAGVANASDEVANDGQNAVYVNVNLGQGGVFTDALAASFNGSSSYLQLPSYATPIKSAASIGMWFKTSTATGMLFDYQSMPLGTANPSGTMNMDAYVGNDGNLYAGFLAGGAYPQMSSKKSVTDGKWHYMLLSGGGTTQSLFLDGQQVNTTTGTAQITPGSQPYVYIGAGTTGSGWTAMPNTTNVYFNGSISDVAFYQNQVSGAQVSAMWSAFQASNPVLPGLSALVPATTAKMVAPSAQSAKIAFDGTAYPASAAKTWSLPGSRMVFQTDGNLVIYRSDSGAPIWNTGTAGNANAQLVFRSDGDLVIYSDSTDSTVLWQSGTNVAGGSANTATLSPDGTFVIAKSDGTALLTASSPVTKAPGVITAVLDPSYGNRELAVTDPTGSTTTYGYDTSGFVNTITDADGDTTTTGHDIRGNVVSKTTCQVQSTNTCSTAYYTYWPDDITLNPAPDPRNDLVATSRDPRSSSPSDNTYLTSYTYDANGNQTSVTTPPVAGFPNGRNSTTAYTTTATAAADSGTTPAGLPNKVVTAGGKTTTTTYNHTGDIAQTTDPAGLVTKYTYDSLGRMLTKTVVSDSYPNGLTTSYTMDGLGRITVETDPVVNDRVTGAIHTPVTNSVFDLDGNVTSKTVTDTTGGDASRVTKTTYTDHDQILTATDPSGAVTTDGYDSDGNLTKVVNANGTETDTAYDAAGRKLTITLAGYTGDPANPSPAKNLVTDSKAYDPAGRLASDTDAMGNTTSYIYTDDGLVAKVTKTDPNGQNPFVVQANTYDAAGNLTSRTTNNGATVTNYTVDAASRVTGQNLDPAGVNRTTAITYTPDDAVASANLRDGSSWNRSITYGYDTAGRQTSQTVHQSSTSTAPASAAGQVGAWNLADGNTTTAADATGNGNIGTLAGGVSWSTDHGGSANFDGTGTITAPSTVVDTSQSYTLSAWVKLADTNGDHYVVSEAGTNNTAGYIGYNKGLNAWIMDTSSGGDSNPTFTWAQSAAGSASVGTWTHLVGTYDAGSHTESLYVNGALAGTGTNASPWKATTPLVIGDTSALQQGGPLTGSISGVKVYNRALSATEAGHLYSGTPAQQPQNGLAGAWNLTDGDVATATDASGNNNTATLSGGASWAGDHNGSLALDGTSGHAVVTKPVVDTGKSFTVATWAMLNTISTSTNQTLLSIGASSFAGFYLEYNGGANAFQFNRPNTSVNPTNWYAAVSTTTPVAGTWYHVAVTVDASTGIAKIYINGALQGTAQADPTPWTASGSLLMGDGYCGGDCNWTNGKITGVQAYNRALSANEISSLYSGNSILPTESTVTTSTVLDERGLPKSSTDARGNVTTYVYDETGHKAITTAPTVSAETSGGTPTNIHPITSIGYDTFGEAVESEDANGNITTTGVDADGRATSVTQPSYTPLGATNPTTAVTQRAYDKLGNPVTVTDPLGNKTSYTYDQRSLQATATAPGGGVVHTAYDAGGEALSVTDATGATTQATWDYMGRKATSTVLERYPTVASYTTTYGYGIGGWLTQTTSPTGTKTSTGYDNVGERTSSTDGAGNVTKYAYDFMGNLSQSTAADGTSTRTSYDALSRPYDSSSYDANGVKLTDSTKVYDGNGNVVSSTDARGTTTGFVFDAANRLSTETQPVTAAATISTSFGYDSAGNRTRYTDGNGGRWITTYNTWNQPESLIEPSTATYNTASTSTFTTVYDADGHPVSQTAPGGVNVATTYDADGNVTGQTGTGAEAATAARSFTFDKGDRMLNASTTAAGPENATSESFTYDDRSLILSASGSAGASSFGYTGDGLMSYRADASGTSTYGYDTADRLSTVNDAASGDTLTYSYNNLDQVSQIGYGTGNDTRSFGYDSLHRLTSDTVKTAGGANVASITYGWDADNSIVSKATTGFGTSASNTYTYDEANRLTNWNNGTASVAYGYDNNGNRTQVGTATYSYDARDQLMSDGTTTYSYTARGTTSAQSGGPAGATSLSFDAYGQDVTAGPDTYTYDGFGRATTIGTTGGGTKSLAYSGMGNLVASDGSNIYGRDPNGSLVGTGNVGQSSGSGNLTWTDAHTDVVGDFTANGSALTESAAYDPTGKSLGTNTVIGSLGYQSEFTDKATGNVNMAARWYNPATGDFLSRDTQLNNPVPNSVNANPFTYANDAPIAGLDPTGHMLAGENGGPTTTTSLGSLLGRVVVDLLDHTVFHPLVVAARTIYTAIKAVVYVAKKIAPYIQQRAPRLYQAISQSFNNVKRAAVAAWHNVVPAKTRQTLAAVTRVLTAPVDVAKAVPAIAKATSGGKILNIRVEAPDPNNGGCAPFQYNHLGICTDPHSGPGLVQTVEMMGLAGTGALLAGPVIEACADTVLMAPNCLRALGSAYTGAFSMATGAPIDGVDEPAAMVVDGNTGEILALPAATRLQRDVDAEGSAPASLALVRPIGQSPTQNQFLQDRIKALRAQGATDFRVNQAQVNADGMKVGANRPDLQYTDSTGRRVYEEFDTSGSDRGGPHGQRIVANDPSAFVVLWTID